jgi:hypothetical protein
MDHDVYPGYENISYRILIFCLYPGSYIILVVSLPSKNSRPPDFSLPTASTIFFHLHLVPVPGRYHIATNIFQFISRGFDKILHLKFRTGIYCGTISVFRIREILARVRIHGFLHKNHGQFLSG